MSKLQYVMKPMVEGARSLSAICAKLETIPGVDSVIIDGDNVWLIGSLQTERDRDLVDAAGEVLRAEGVDPGTVAIDVLCRAEARRRVRFEGVERTEEPDMRVRVRVALEWQGEIVIGEASGEKGLNIELRTAALAALEALDRVSEDAVGARLAGVKHVRAFDAELMVVSLYRTQPEFQKYLGVVLVGSDHLRAAALAVLHALNRVLGNYLITR